MPEFSFLVLVSGTLQRGILILILMLALALVLALLV